MSAENEKLAVELAMGGDADPVTMARQSAEKVTAYIEGLDAADKILEEEIAVITKKIEANHRKREKAKARRKMLREMANSLEAEKDAE